MDPMTHITPERNALDSLERFARDLEAENPLKSTWSNSWQIQNRQRPMTCARPWTNAGQSWLCKA